MRFAMDEDRPDWPHAASPFHAGEVEAQARLGLDQRLERTGRRIVRAVMPAEHRELFERLPMLAIGSIDPAGRVWASALFGEPGFVAAPDPAHLSVAAIPDPADPAAAGLEVGAPVGLLGIEFATRRRNRMNGVLERKGAGGLRVGVRQSFGNCPKYIHRRAPLGAAPERTRSDQPEGPALSPEALSLLARADTLFLATASGRAGSAEEPAEGVDVSHRGGAPGFVTAIPSARGHRLVLPDYLGNFLFNSLGNLLVNPRAGLLVLDFERGDMLELTGTARIDWSPPDPGRHPGAQRLVLFEPEAGRLARGALPWRWTPAVAAPEAPQL
jgi:predicted pyridoxine 5'-phosphate oxidase superfamily flavin-nucleotide-binding protein